MALRFRLLAMLIALLVCRAVAQSSSPQQVQVSQGVSQGLLIYRVQPTYPPPALQARVQGTVVLQALIGKDGTIQNLTVISGHPMLIQAAMDAVKQWRYKPYLLNGEPVLVRTTINVNFVLSGAPSGAQPTEPAASSSSSNNGASSPPLGKEGLEQRSFRLVSPDGKFEASFPGQPKEEDTTSDSGPFHMEGRAYSFQDATAKFVLSYTDLTPFPTDLKPGDALDAAISGTVGNVKGTLVRQQLLTLRGVPAKSALIAVAGSTILEGQFLCVKHVFTNCAYFTAKTYNLLRGAIFRLVHNSDTGRAGKFVAKRSSSSKLKGRLSRWRRGECSESNLCARPAIFRTSSRCALRRLGGVVADSRCERFAARNQSTALPGHGAGRRGCQSGEAVALSTSHERRQASSSNDQCPSELSPQVA
jgi:TonB family protein